MSTNSKHAKLSASGAHRWMVCPASASLEQNYAETYSPFAAEGTAAHELAEKCLKLGSPAINFLGDEINGFIVDSEMVDSIQVYIDYINSHNGEKFYEQRVDFSVWVPDGFGTCDCIVLSDGEASIIDLKYGKGVQVDAENNAQTQLYALGALNEFEFLFDEIHTFNLAIVQPRLDHISEWRISKGELLKFGDFASERAAMTLTENPIATPDEKACRFCKAKGNCRSLAEKSLSEICNDFEDIHNIELKPLPQLSNEELAAILPNLKSISDWVKAVEAHATAELEKGNAIDGYKLVEGRSVRQWVDEKSAEKALKSASLKTSQIFTKKIISPTQAEKFLGKKHAILDEQVVKPKGTPTLAPCSDKRPAIEINILKDFENNK